MQPLALLKKRIDQDWLFGYRTEALVELAEQRYQELLQHEFPPKVVLVDRDPLRFLAGFIAACSAPCHVFLCNPEWGETEWQQVSNLVTPTLVWGDRAIPLTGSTPQSIAPLIMIPTGGTSGQIRFAMQTWETLSASVVGFRQYFEVDRVHSFCVLPLYHVSGLMQFMRSFLSNGTLIVQSWRSLETDLEIDPQDFFLSLVPTQLQRLIEVEQLSRFRTILLGGAPAWAELLDQARSQNFPIAPTYGMTETASQVATLKPAEFLSGFQGCGRVLPHAEITIDAKTSKLSIQAKSLMLGYYPEFSEQAKFDPDDLGYFDDQGYLHILGRDSNKIITGGENVFPAEVEAAIRATQLVKDVYVLGLPDLVWGQIVTAIYVANHDAVASEKLAEELRSQLSHFKQPKRWIKVNQIPRNAQGKINRDHILQVLNE